MSRGRPKKFNNDQALHDAMLVFWRHGYRGTALDDITAALNINKPSLYAAFGGKEELFLQVIDHYRSHILAPIAKPLSECSNLKDGLRQYFRDIAKIVMGKETPPGCLVACMLAEECCQTESIKAKLAGAIAESDRFFCRVFEKHIDELNPQITPEAAAVLLVSTLHGLSIRARAGASQESIESGASAFLRVALKQP